jgi:hypothetical protein
MKTKKAIALIGFFIVMLWVVIACVFTDCNIPKIDRPDVIGEYVSNDEQSNYKNSNPLNPELQGGIHRLILRNNGTYKYTFTSFDGDERFENSNNWKFQDAPDQNLPEIVLEQFYFGDGHVGTKNGRAIVKLPVCRWFGKVRIVINSDLGCYFRKTRKQ